MKIYILFFLIFSSLASAYVGKVSTVNGEVSLHRDAQKLDVKTGLELLQQDIVKTSDTGRLQMIFQDQTIISIGKNSSFNIEEYLYDTKKPENIQATFQVSKGIFKAITGRIGKINPSKFKLKTRTASIGIRGTVFFGDIRPGQAEVIVCTQGSIVVETPYGTVTILEGQFTRIEEGQAPTAPAPITIEQKEQLEKDSGVTRNQVIQELATQKTKEEDVSKLKNELLNQALSFTVQNNTNYLYETETTPATLFTFDSLSFDTMSTSLTELSSGNSLYDEVVDKLGNGGVAQINDSDSNFDWGYWNNSNFGSSTNPVKAVWVKSTQTVTDITTLSGTAQYSGSIIGQYFDSGPSEINTSTSSITLNFDFGANTASVNMTVNNNANYNIPTGTYSTNGNTYTLQNGSEYVTGEFYNNGNLTAGKFNIENNQAIGNFAKGVYKATKQ